MLSATAELNGLGQLLVMGASTAETIQLQVDGAGDLLLRDEAGTIIPIENHPDGAAFETNPLDPSAITSGKIIFDTGGSFDLLDLQLPSGLDVTVQGGDGDDIAILRFADDRSPGTINIDAESIRIDVGANLVSANGAELILAGDVSFGIAGQSSEFALGSGSLEVIGRLIVSGNALFTGMGASIDLSSAALTTSSGQTTFAVDLQNLAGNHTGADLTFGGADDSAGSFIGNIDVRAASSVSFLNSSTVVLEDVSVSGVDNIRVDEDIRTTMGPQDGDVLLESLESLSITSGAMISVGDGTITIDGGGSVVDLGDGALQSDNADDAITIGAASEVTFGDVTAGKGILTVGVNGDVSGDISQAPGTTVVIDRLVVESDGSIDLTNPGNQIRTVERIDVDQDVSIANAESELSIVKIDSRGQNVRLVALQAITIGNIDASSADVRLGATSINDASDDSLVDIIGSRLFMFAQKGIGDIRPLELMSVSELTVRSGTSDIALEHLGDQPIELRSVIARDGAITIGSTGSIIATEVISENLARVDDGSRDIRLTTRSDDGDIVVTTITAAGDADVVLQAGDDILDSDPGDANRLTADDLRLIANNGNADSDVAVDLATSVNDFQASVVGDNRGDLLIRQSGAISLASSDANGDEIVETTNGQIVITADGDISINDTSLGDDGDDWKLDPEIVARGGFGRIDLESLGVIRLQDDVQLHASKITTQYPNPESVTDPVDPGLQRSDRAVFLKSDSIVFGQRIEINTGVDQGVARFFATRPIVEIDRSDPDHPTPAPPVDPDQVPAFFDPFSVDTNRLTQAVVNDATGILTVDLGREGERGLTVDIDWGAGSDFSRGIGRFQQLNGLSADDTIIVAIEPNGPSVDPTIVQDGNGRLEVEHLYTEAAILESRENGRTSATDSLEIRFSVRHHDSIFVEANAVSQSPESEQIAVPGRVVSSTDNPSTLPVAPSGLENGQASFIIPSLSIPVAFFPVRDVIPELETQEFVVRSEPFVPLSGGFFETSEGSSAPSVGREEFFQIRILSPDPDGEDLAAPQRLPNDILNGDKIQRLFQQLPDGRYEVQYILGDGNERSILRVDVRDGEAAIPDEALEAEGLLELESGDEPSNSDDVRAPETEPNRVEPNRAEPNVAEPNHPEQVDPGDDDSVWHQPSATTPVLATAMLATTIRRRHRRRIRRLSVAGRFASQYRQIESSGSRSIPSR